MYKVAILADWENIRKSVFHRSKKMVDYNNSKNLEKFLTSFIEKNEGEELYRIYIYVGKPPREYKKSDGTKVSFRDFELYKKSRKFLKILRNMNYVSIREGPLVQRGNFKDGTPKFNQKQVDLKIGLDVANLTTNKIVDRVLFLTGDTDITPALEYARSRGLQTILGHCDVEANYPHRFLKEETDILRVKKFKEIFPD
jgi:uncharacterized LabA/DUF88 family protein